MLQESITQFTESQCDELAKYYGTLPDTVRLKIHERQSKQINIHRKRLLAEGYKIHEISHSMFLLVLDRYRTQRAQSTAASKMPSIDTKRAQEIEDAELDWVRSKFRRGRKPIHEETIRKHLRQILRWKHHPKHPCSWREVKALMLRRYGVDISHTTIRDTVLKLQKAEQHRNQLNRLEREGDRG